MMAGAKVTMLASELIAKGLGRATEILADMEEWMANLNMIRSARCAAA